MKRIHYRLLALAVFLGLTIVVSGQPSSPGGLLKVVHDGTLTGSGTNPNPLKLTLCAANQIYQMNSGGSAWACGALTTGITGTGTSGRSSRWTGTSVQGTGAWTDDGANATANGTTTVQQLISTQISPTAVTGTQNDWNPIGLSAATTILVTSSSGTISLTGIVGGVNGRRLVVVNHDATQNLLIRNEQTSSVVNRIVTNYGDDILLSGGLDSNVTLEYWSSRWHVIAINTFTPPGMAYQGNLTVGGLITLATNGNITSGTGTVEGNLVVAGGGNFSTYLGGNGAIGQLGFNYFTAGSATGYINNTSDSGGTSNFRSLEIDDGKGSGGTGGSHYIASFDGTTRTARFNDVSVGLGNFTVTAASGNLFTQGTSQLNGTVSTGSWITAGTSIYTGGGPATEYISSGVGGIGHTAGLNCQYSNNAPATCYINTDGYAESTTQPRSLWIQDGQGSAASHSIAQFDAPTHEVTFPNQPVGALGNPDGTRIEQFDDFFYGFQSTFLTGGNFGDWAGFTATGTNIGTASNTAGTGGSDRHPGQLNLHYTTSAAAGSSASLVKTNASIDPHDFTDLTFETAVDWFTLSSSSSAIASLYRSIVGWNDSFSAGGNAANGCYFAYDKGNQLTGNKNAGNVDALECWCSAGSTRTGYLINATGNSDETFALGTGTVVANTWYRLKIVFTVGVRAEFYRNGTKVCDINTNLPSTNAYLVPGYTFYTNQATGTAIRDMYIDYFHGVYNLTSARTP